MHTINMRMLRLIVLYVRKPWNFKEITLSSQFVSLRSINANRLGRCKNVYGRTSPVCLFPSVSLPWTHFHMHFYSYFNSVKGSVDCIKELLYWILNCGNSTWIKKRPEVEVTKSQNPLASLWIFQRFLKTCLPDVFE